MEEDLYKYLLQNQDLKGMFENWGFDDKVIISRCSDLVNKIKSYLYIFDYPSIKEGVSKDPTFHDACLNNILQIRKLLTQLPKNHLEDLRKLGIIVIAPGKINSKPFIPFNDIVLTNMDRVFSDILGYQSDIKKDSIASGNFKTIIRGIVFENSNALDIARKKLEVSIEHGNVILIKDVLRLLEFVERFSFHFQRCEIKDYDDFVKDKACIDAISYTLLEAIRCLEKSSDITKSYFDDLGIDLVSLTKPHVAIVKRGITQFENINENYYLEELWSQTKEISNFAFNLCEIATK